MADYDRYAHTDDFYKPISGFKNFGLKPGDHITFSHGIGTWTRHEPDYIEVVEEYPTFIVCEYVYIDWTGHKQSYKRCINKALVVSGDIVFRKVA